MEETCTETTCEVATDSTCDVCTETTTCETSGVDTPSTSDAPPTEEKSKVLDNFAILENFPQREAILEAEAKIVRWLDANCGRWRGFIEREFSTLSEGKVRAFHTFFENIETALSGSFTIQPLNEESVSTVYPALLNPSKALSMHGYLYIFTCKNPVNDNALVSNKILYYSDVVEPLPADVPVETSITEPLSSPTESTTLCETSVSTESLPISETTTQ